MKRYAFCPVCGTPYPGSRPSDPSLLECGACGYQFWQNSKPTVGALITRIRGGRPEVLLCRRAGEPAKGRWDLPGGFLANGERPEDGLDRELREELGVGSRAARFYGVDVAEYGRDDQAVEARFVLTLFYRCEIEEGTALRAADDVAEVRWYPLAEMPAEMAFETDVRALRRLARELGAG